MTEKDDFLEDDFLRDLIRRSPLDSPTDGFVDRVMENLSTVPEVVAVKTPFYHYIRSAAPYAIVTLVLMCVIATSDLPVFNWLPGKDYFLSDLLPYFGTLLATFKSAFSSKYVSWVLLISFSAGILFFVDRIFSRRTSL
jgi:hypothetical protein